MKAKVYRGTKEIGGTCVELIADNGLILWIDLGSPLDTANHDVAYANNRLDALLISHPHKDHYGLMEKVDDKVPIYIGELSLDLINATKLFRGEPQLSRNFIRIKPWSSFLIADTFKVTPFLTDHSTPEAFAFLIEADGKRVFYSGDFRATGRKSKLYDSQIKNPPHDIDLLLIEGTMVERTNHRYSTEDSVEEAIYDIIKDQQNLSFVISSAQNIDRFVSVFRACRRAGKKVVIDVYTAWVLDMVKKQAPSIPTIEWDDVKVYEPQSQLDKINDGSFDDFRKRIKQQAIGNVVFNRSSEFVYFVRYPTEKFVDSIRRFGIINIIYSQWEGYLNEQYKQHYADYLNRLKNDTSIMFQSVHTSGHATVSDLMRFAKALNPRQMVPIHTAYPEKFKEEFEKAGFANVTLWDDGNEYQL
jgi:ribonuclease J